MSALVCICSLKTSVAEPEKPEGSVYEPVAGTTGAVGLAADWVVTIWVFGPETTVWLFPVAPVVVEGPVTCN